LSGPYASRAFSRQQYRLVKRLAIGGMAELFLARAYAGDVYLRTVVVKTPRRDAGDGERAAECLRREAEVGAVLDHPGIVRLLDAEVEGSAPFLVQEYIFGRDLAQVARRCRRQERAIPTEHVATMVADLVDALDYAYFGSRAEDGPLRIVHRDVSPENVVVGFDGRVRLVDFGLATDATGRPTRGPSAGGKAAYMAPEQIRGDRVDHRSDLFAAGVLAWELLTGRRLFPGGSGASAATEGTERASPWPRAGDRAVPVRMAWWVWRALRRAPALRPRRGRDWARAWAGDAPGARRRDLADWMADLYRGPLQRRERELRALADPRERRMVRDGGFELLPMGTVTEDLSAPPEG